MTNDKCTELRYILSQSVQRNLSDAMLLSGGLDSSIVASIAAKEIEGLQLNEDVLRLGVENALKRKECRYFVAESDGEVIGQTMITYEWSDWRNGVIWWLQSIYVKPDYRKQGVFKAIFHHIETLAKNDPQIKALRLYVMKNNQSGKSAYKKLRMNA